MKKTFRIILHVIAIAVAILICTWTIMWGYITYNKEAIIEKVKAGINRQVKGKVEIGGLSTNFFYNFPNIAIRLSDVSIKDSLWSRHHHDFLKAENIYIRLQLFSLFSGKPEISKITIEKAAIYYYTDSTGYSNLVSANKTAEKNKEGNIPDLLFKNTRFVYDYPGHNKFHDVEVNKMECNIISNDSGQVFKIDINARVHNLGFNTTKGSYLKEKNLSGDFKLQLTKTKDIKFDNVKLYVDNQPFMFTGFFSTTDTASFSLTIQTQKIKFKNAISLLTQTTQQKFTAFNILQPVDINAELSGSTIYKTIPLAAIHFLVKDAGIETPAGPFNNCSFTGDFINEVTPAKPRTDENSKLSLKNFTGSWENISLMANKIEVSNIVQPFLTCDLHSVFDLAALNDLTGSSSIQFMKGNGEMDISYQGSLTSNDTIATVMEGNIRLKDAAINYVPRNITLNKLQGNFIFKNKDLVIEHLKAQAGSTELNMTGAIKNLTELIYAYPEKLVLEWNVNTPYLDFDDFINFLGKKSRRAIKNSSGKNRLIHVANKIDSMLEYGSANLNIQAAKLNYKKFTATNVSTSLSLLQNKIVLNSAKLNHAGGSILLSGSFSDEGVMNAIKLQSTIHNADIPALFQSFNNFGQDAITSQNMKGQLSAHINLTATLTDKAIINSNSLISTISFSVLHGELNNFEPLQKIFASVFKKRDFSSVRFAELNNKLQVNGSAITFDKMEIRSNVFTMFVEGLYDTKNGTDINIEVPLSNLKKIDEEEEIVKKGKTGAKIRLRAQTGDDGKLKISWNPFNNKNKTKEKNK